MKSRREVRSVGVARSLGGAQSLVRCVVCGRSLPRTAIHHIGRRPYTLKNGRTVPRAFCGECWASGRYLRGDWTVR